MDMSNATAGGPSRGILDILFGSSKGAEEAKPDGQEFGGLMDLIKALKEKKDSEALGADASRTPGETAPGKGGTDGSAVGMPGMMPMDAQGSPLASTPVAQDEKEKSERLAKLSLLLGNPLAAAALVPAPAQPMEAMPSLRAEQVNQALQQKSLPPLSPQEMKLLQEVNGKIAQVNSQPTAALAGMTAPMANPKAAIPKEPPVNVEWQKALASKGMDPRKMKAETTAIEGTPEKMVSTESYLQMHESVKAPGKDVAGKGPESTNAEPVASAVRPAESLTANAVAGATQKGIASRKDEMPELPESSKQAKLDQAGGFGSLLAQQSANEIMRHDVFLPGSAKPEELRRALVGELGTGVALHVGKGGGEMRLVLHPDDMGEGKPKVGTQNGKVEVQVTADNEEIAALIRSGSSDLEKTLKEQNLSLAKFEVSVSDTTTVASLDTKNGLNDQFMSQQNQQQSSGGFSQGMSGDDRRSSSWGDPSGGRQAMGGDAQADNSGRSAASRFVPKPVARDSSRRLDVVA